MKIVKTIPELKLVLLFAFVASMLLVATPVHADDPIPPDPQPSEDLPI